MDEEEFNPQQALNDVYTVQVAQSVAGAYAYLNQIKRILSSPNVQPLSAGNSFELNLLIEEFQYKVDELLRREIDYIKNNRDLDEGLDFGF